MSKSKKFIKKDTHKVTPYSTYSFKTKRIGGFKRYNKNRKTKQKANIEVRLFLTRFIREMKKSFQESESDWTYCWVGHRKLTKEDRFDNNGRTYSHLDFCEYFAKNPALKEKLEEDSLKLYEVIGELNEKQKTETE